MYATLDDYETFIGTAPEGIEKLLDQASDLVDSVTFNRIRGVGFDNLTDYQQKMIRKAVCYQASFKTEYGEYEGVSSFSAGSISVTMNTASLFNGQTMSGSAVEYLKNTGLTSRNLLWGRGYYG